MPTYVRRKDSDTWHWCKNCSQYPKGTDVIKQTLSGKTRPSYGELHNECLAKEKDGKCET